jgi:hypothetical protein
MFLPCLWTAEKNIDMLHYWLTAKRNLPLLLGTVEKNLPLLLLDGKETSFCAVGKQPREISPFAAGWTAKRNLPFAVVT